MGNIKVSRKEIADSVVEQRNDGRHQSGGEQYRIEDREEIAAEKVCQK